MQSVGQQLIIAAIPGIPFLTFLALVLFGRLLQENAQYVAILGITISLVFSVFTLLSVAGIFGGGGGPISFAVNWIDLGPGGSFPMGIYIDGLAAMMIVVVCFVSLMIQLYSGGFMADDARFGWYYAVINLFTASMLGLVLAPNFIELYIFWELVGLCSYLLIGHWSERPKATLAAKKAFIVTRVGDMALFVSIIIFWRETGTTSFSGISQAAQAGFMGDSLLTTALILVFIGACGKSAQFPLHVWLPDAMEGPTPVSALIHAATMVAAGVYLVARTYDIFVQSPTAMLVVAYIGGFTALMAATMALVKKDIKRVIAYSTISQLGYMMMALGVGAFSGGLFHLYNHAFFKALLFLGAGAVIYAMNSYNLTEMGGLRRRMPITFWTMVIAGLSLSGIFPLSGFWSKDAILAGAFDEHFYVLYGMGLLTVLFTAFYIFRAIFMAFTGEPRSEAARVAVDPPGIMTIPMVILAVLSVVSGWIGIPKDFGMPLGGVFESFVAPSNFAQRELAIKAPTFDYVLGGISLIMALAGIGLAYVLFVRRPNFARTLMGRLVRPRAFLDRGWYIDALYEVVFVRSVKRIGILVREFDWRILSGLLVGGFGHGVFRSGDRLKTLQSGGVQTYALFFLLGVLVIGVIVGADTLLMMVALIAVVIIAIVAWGVRL